MDTTERTPDDRRNPTSEPEHGTRNWPVFESLRDAVFVVDGCGEFLDVNPAGVALLGYTPPELKELSVKSALVVPEISSTAEEQRILSQGGTLEAALRHKEGHILPVELSISPVSPEDTEENCALAIVIARDITLRQQAQRTIEESRRQWGALSNETSSPMQETEHAKESMLRRERLATMGELAGAVGHELRNPLAVITNAVYFLNTILVDPDEMVQEYLSIIEEQVQKADAIVSGLLDFGRSHPPSPQEVEMMDVVEQVLAEHLVPPEIDLSIDIPKDLPPVRVDPQHLSIALTHVIVNAGQAMPEGGQLTIRARTEEQTVQLTVTDTGAGIKPEHQPRLFEPLFTTKSRGIGLGLALTKRLLEANEGSIGAESTLGQGSVFTITLPLAV